MAEKWTERVRRADPARRRWLREARITVEAVIALSEDTGKTEHVFEVLENFPVMDVLRWHAARLPILRDPRFVALWERRARPDFTTATALGLVARPAGTLGHEYGRFVAARRLDNLFLEDLELDTPAKYLAWRTAHLHDLLHFVLGYAPFDPIGEMEVEAFLYAQTGALNHVLFLAGYAMNLARNDRATLARAAPAIRAAYRYGRRAAPVLLVEWETLLDRPLDDVRRELGIAERPACVVAPPPPPPRLAHTVHNVPDLAAAVAFYRDAFGYRIAAVDEALGVTFLTAGDDHHTIALQEAPSLSPRGAIAAARRLRALWRGWRGPDRSASGRRRVLPTWPVVRASLRPGHNHTGYRVADDAALRALIARVRAAGGRVVWAVNHGDLVRGVYVVDPAGNLCELFVDGDAARAVVDRLRAGDDVPGLGGDLANYALDLGELGA